MQVVVLKYSIVWLVLAAVAIANGMIRQSTYGKYVSELSAHQISTVTAILATGAVVWFISRIWPIESAAQAWSIGLIWFLATILFEFGFGHYVAGHPWHRLLADYNVLNGRVWALFLVWIMIMPWVIFRIGNIQSH